MTKWQFVKSYLSPLMFFFRLIWLGMSLFFGFLAYLGFHWSFWLLSALLMWLALYPWGTTNLNEVNQKLDKLNKKYK